jgi:hypothetical protein
MECSFFWTVWTTQGWTLSYNTITLSWVYLDSLWYRGLGVLLNRTVYIYGGVMALKRWRRADWVQIKKSGLDWCHHLKLKIGISYYSKNRYVLPFRQCCCQKTRMSVDCWVYPAWMWTVRPALPGLPCLFVDFETTWSKHGLLGLHCLVLAMIALCCYHPRALVCVTFISILLMCLHKLL